jgi:hypothetical protein
LPNAASFFIDLKRNGVEGECDRGARCGRGWRGGRWRIPWRCDAGTDPATTKLQLENKLEIAVVKCDS